MFFTAIDPSNNYFVFAAAIVWYLEGKTILPLENRRRRRCELERPALGRSRGAVTRLLGALHFTRVIVCKRKWAGFRRSLCDACHFLFKEREELMSGGVYTRLSVAPFCEIDVG